MIASGRWPCCIALLVTTADPDEATTALAGVRLAWAELQADVEIEEALAHRFDAATEAVREAVDVRRQERAAEEARGRTGPRAGRPPGHRHRDRTTGRP